MMTRIMQFIALFSIMLNVNARTNSIDLSPKKQPTISRIMAISCLCGVLGGGLAALNESPYGTNRLVGLSALFGPFFATVASIIATTIASGKLRFATLFIPAYIATPAFYVSWLTTHYLMNKSHAGQNGLY